MRFGQFSNFRSKVCFSASGFKRFEILPFFWLVNSIHFSPLSQGYYSLFLFGQGILNTCTLCLYIK
ncbi:hypothetical protein Hanom_Chr17g01539011 [Helianthus anomalus]